MAIKKHKLTVQINGGQELPSSFVVDLRPESDSDTGSRISDTGPAIANADYQAGTKNDDRKPGNGRPVSEKENNKAAFANPDFQKLHERQSSVSADSEPRAPRRHLAKKYFKQLMRPLRRLWDWIRDGLSADQDDFKELLLYPVWRALYRAGKIGAGYAYRPLLACWRPLSKFGRYLGRKSAKAFGVIAFVPEYCWRKLRQGQRRLLHKRNWRQRWQAWRQQTLHLKTVKRLHSINYYRRSLAEDFKREQLAAIYARRRPAARWRRVAGFALLLLLIILPFKALVYYRLINLSGFRDRVATNASGAWQEMLSAGTAAGERRFADASRGFAAAGNGFLKVREELRQVDELLFGLASLSNDPKLKLASAGQDITAAGVDVSGLGQHLSAAFDSLFSEAPDKNLGAMLDNFTAAGLQAVADSRRLNQHLARIKPEAVPEAYQAQFQDLKRQSQIMEKGLGDFIDLAASLKDFLGVSQTKRYLLVFQNNSELRASGGFLGSYALIDFKDGKIKNLEVPAGGTYDTEAGLRVLVKAPEPLWLVNPLWHLWDANWWASWPASARNLMWFYEKSSGPTVDGVISMTPTVLEKLLAVTGPIDMVNDYGVTITADNFWQTTQTIVETTGNPALYASSTPPATSTAASINPKKSKKIKKGANASSTVASLATSTPADATKPKKIIGDLFNRILERLPQVLTRDNFPKFLAAAESSLSEKQLMFYFSDQALQAKIEARGWGGTIEDTPGDYLAVINTNIAGGKSDRSISENLFHQAEVAADGSIIDTVRITRTHNGIKGEPFTGVRNVDWLRVYVPAGSQLISASGFRVPDAKYFESPDPAWQDNKLVAATEGRASVDPDSGVKIYRESGKTVFANWTMADPGETIQIEFKYRLPFRFGSLHFKRQPATASWWSDLWDRTWKLVSGEEPELTYYSLLVQKQPGAASEPVQVSFKGVPALWRPVWRYPLSASLPGSWQEEATLDRDRLWMGMYSKN